MFNCNVTTAHEHIAMSMLKWSPSQPYTTASRSLLYYDKLAINRQCFLQFEQKHLPHTVILGLQPDSPPPSSDTKQLWTQWVSDQMCVGLSLCKDPILKASGSWFCHRWHFIVTNMTEVYLGCAQGCHNVLGGGVMSGWVGWNMVTLGKI